MTEKQELIKFDSINGEVSLNADFENDTIWATQEQIAAIFGVQRPAITKHIRNIYRTEELDEEMVSSKMELTTQHGAISGKTQRQEVKIYNLDLILSIGYRVNSKKATEFRKWSNTVLKKYLTKGYVINQKRLDELHLMLNIFERSDTPEIAGLSNIMNEYTSALLLLEGYDEHALPDVEGTPDTWQLTYEEARSFLDDIKTSALFAKERTGQFKGIIEQIYQSFAGVDFYHSVEEKAANLLYFIVKDHPFYDGNKRSAAALFVYFLHKNHALRNINNNTLAAIVLMVALSAPDERENIILLIRNFLQTA